MKSLNFRFHLSSTSKVLYVEIFRNNFNLCFFRIPSYVYKGWVCLTSRASTLIANSIQPLAKALKRIQFHLHLQSWGEIFLGSECTELCKSSFSVFLHQTLVSENVPGLFEISQNLNELPLKCKCGWFTVHKTTGANIFISSVWRAPRRKGKNKKGCFFHDWNSTPF